jgi:hypothetical protein
LAQGAGGGGCGAGTLQLGITMVELKGADQPSLISQLPLLDGGGGKLIDIINVSNKMDGCFIDSLGIEGVSAARSSTVPSGKAVSETHKTRR